MLATGPLIVRLAEPAQATRTENHDHLVSCTAERGREIGREKQGAPT